MGRYNDYYGWPRYVPVAERRAQAEREVKRLRKKGLAIEPVEIQGRMIARTFWGKAWCKHLESFGDYSNRLPRGRKYVRHGAVCHLDIGKGRVEAMVAGSEIYNVEVDIKTLNDEKWEALKAKCIGRIGSLIELLQGQLSEDIMETVTDREEGLFPMPGEIEYSCDCPDWADMCKHISAVMYGIGARLDSQPELLFHLRAVEHEELISSGDVAAEITGRRSDRSRRRSLSGEDVENVFGVDFDETPMAPANAEAEKRKSSEKGKGAAKTVAKKPPKKVKKKSFQPTAKSVAGLRQDLGMSVAEFAREVGVSGPTVRNWEKSASGLNPQARNLASLKRLHKRATKESTK